MQIICLLGHARVGKDQVGAYIKKAVPRCKTMAFADHLKDVCAEVLDLPIGDFYTEEGKARTTRYERNTCPQCFSSHTQPWVSEDYPLKATGLTACNACGAVGDTKMFHGYWTNREIAQHIGTEGFRAVSPNVWVDYLLKKALVEIQGGAALVVVTDGRFRSECEGVWKLGGAVWRIKRPGMAGNVGIANHKSETEQDSIKDEECQAVIDNDGTLEDLKRKVAVALRVFRDANP